MACEPFTVARLSTSELWSQARSGRRAIQGLFQHENSEAFGSEQPTIEQVQPRARCGFLHSIGPAVKQMSH